MKQIFILGLIFIFYGCSSIEHYQTKFNINNFACKKSGVLYIERERNQIKSTISYENENRIKETFVSKGEFLYGDKTIVNKNYTPLNQERIRVSKQKSKTMLGKVIFKNGVTVYAYFSEPYFVDISFDYNCKLKATLKKLY